MVNLILNREDRNRTFALILAGIIIFAGATSIGGGSSNGQMKETGTANSSFADGAVVAPLTNIGYPIPFVNTPTLVCCYFTTGFIGLKPMAFSWSTVFVPPQTRNATTPTFDTFARHDQNNSTCAPCLNKVTITPSSPYEALIVHIFYISDVTITVTSVTASGLTFTPGQPFGPGGSDEVWYTRSFTTSPILITVTFNAPSSTIVTSSIVATTFKNTIGVIGVTGTSGSTSPITISGPIAQFSTVVGNVWLADTSTACHDPTPGAGQTQILNANVFCATNTNGGFNFIYNYDVEYEQGNSAATYTYSTNFNGTLVVSGTGLSVNVILGGNSYHDKTWAITGTSNSTLYNSEQYDTVLNPTFASQAAIASVAGTFNFVCNYASENVSLTMGIFDISDNFLTVSFNVGYSGTICDGGLHRFNIQNTYGLASNALGKIVAWCTACPNPLFVSIANMFIGWRMLGQVSLNFAITAQSNTGFSVRWLSSWPVSGGQGVSWSWTATGT